MKLGRLLVRLVVGGLFIGHGTQKLFGWFGGGGPEGTARYFESLGLRPGRRQALAAGASEAGGGALLAAGLLTPLAAASISGTMITAIRTVHGPKGPWISQGGYEYNAVLLAVLFVLSERGPGPWSLDSALGIRMCGLGWAFGQFAVAAAASTAVLANRQPPPPPEAEPRAATPEPVPAEV